MLVFNMTTIINRIWRREPYFTELLSGFTAFAWSLMAFFAPGDLSDWPSMAFMMQFGGENFWVVISLLVGGGQFVAVMYDKRWPRWIAAAASCWFWAILTVTVWAAVPWAPGVVVYAAFVLSNIFSILRLLKP